jgi:hypothetical protein
MKAKTKPLGAGTANLSINMPKALKGALEGLATQSDMGVGAYCRRVLEDAAKRKVRFIVTVAGPTEL